MFQIQVGRGISKQGPHIIAMPPLELRGEFLVFLFPRLLDLLQDIRCNAACDPFRRLVEGVGVNRRHAEPR